MAEIKNSFLRSKMNKDLDDRLIPNGEYRDAQNISVGKSEADDIGALETVLGNTLKSNFGLSNSAIEVVGQMAIEERNSIIVFLSDYTDPYTNGNPTLAPSTNNCYIFEYSNGTATKLVEGNFLNFSINKPVLGISVIESLLFFTDNRNQPRKININLADDGAYYTQESDISVAKYNPYKPISFLKTVNTTTTTSGSSSTLAIANTTGIEKGMSVVEYGNTNIEPQDYIYVTNVVTNTSVTLNTSVSGLTSGDTIYFISTTMTGENITFNFNSGLSLIHI